MWVGLFFMLAAISIYVLSNNLSFFAQREARHAQSHSALK